VSCYGQAFYQNYQRRLKFDPIGALHMLREKKHEEIKKIDIALACYGMVREEAQTVEKESRN
jgi:hypothetical protein